MFRFLRKSFESFWLPTGVILSDDACDRLNRFLRYYETLPRAVIINEQQEINWDTQPIVEMYLHHVVLSS